MAKFRVVVELDSYDRISAMAAVNGCFAIASSGGAPPMGIKVVMKATQIRGPKHMKGWRASHDARFVTPESEFGGSCRTPWLCEQGATYDDIGPICETRKIALRTIQTHMRLGNRHGWSEKRRDYSIHKVK